MINAIKSLMFHYNQSKSMECVSYSFLLTSCMCVFMCIGAAVNKI